MHKPLYIEKKFVDHAHDCGNGLCNAKIADASSISKRGHRINALWVNGNYSFLN